MRKKFIPLSLALCLTLSGCGGNVVLERSYSVSTPHSEVYWENEGADTLRADSYQDLVNALLLLLGEHSEEGVVRIYSEEDAAAMAEQACKEVQEETALGAYLLDYISYTDTQERAYYEMHVRLGYRRTAEEQAGIVTATSTEALPDLLRLTAREGSLSRIAVRFTYFTADRDGIRDMVYDINSPGESTRIISKLMQWTDDRQVHIHTILHQNKGDENARGHIGTEINNKSETVLRVEKDKNEDLISTVEAVYIRDVSFPSFAFRINSEALPEIISDYEPTPDSRGNEAWDPYHDISEDTHRSALDSVFTTPEKMLRHGELMDALREAYGNEDIELSDYKLKILITFLRNKRMIEQVDKGKKKGNPYRYLHDFYY